MQLYQYFIEEYYSNIFTLQLINKLDDITQPLKTIFLACEEDMELALDAAKRGIKTFSGEWFLSCVMTQELDLEAPQFTESL